MAPSRWVANVDEPESFWSIHPDATGGVAMLTNPKTISEAQLIEVSKWTNRTVAVKSKGVMSPNSRRSEDLLGNANYFHWEFNMRMTLARKGLADHLVVVKTEAEETEAWRVSDMKALGIIAQGLEVVHQSKIRAARTAKEAWDTLSEYYNRRNLQNRVTLTRRLHEFRMDPGASMETHLDNFDELVIAMQAVGDQIDEPRQLVILLGSLPPRVKEKLIKESENRVQAERQELAFKARFKTHPGKHGRKGAKTVNRNRGNQATGARNHCVFRGKCYGCNKVGHMKKDCPDQSSNRDSEVMFMANQAETDGWLLDSGASSHMTFTKLDFQTYEVLPEPVEIIIADGATMKAIGVGNIRIKIDNGRIVTITEVLHIPQLDRRLISISKLTQRGLGVRFNLTHCAIMNGDDVLVQAQRYKNIYKLNAVPEEGCFLVEHGDAQSKWELWHARLGHTTFENYSRLQSEENGLPVIAQKSYGLCGGCLKGKQTITSFPRSTGQKKTTHVLQLVHTDVMGPMATTSHGGARYLLTFIDDYSRFVTGYFLKRKSEVADKFSEFKAMAENQWGQRIKCVRSDNGSEFVNKRFNLICSASGIVHQLSTPYSPQQNGLAERMNRTIMEMARSMMQYKCIEHKWWGEACNTAIYIINRITNTAHPKTTAHEICYGAPPYLDHLRVFGSLGYAHIDKAKRTKLDPKSFKCMLLGYSSTSKAYRVLNIETGKIAIIRSVSLDEREIGGIYDRVHPVADGDSVSTRVAASHWCEDETRTVPIESIQVSAPNDDVEMQYNGDDGNDYDRDMESGNEEEVNQLVISRVIDPPSPSPATYRHIHDAHRGILQRPSPSELLLQQTQQPQGANAMVFRPELRRRMRGVNNFVYNEDSTQPESPRQLAHLNESVPHHQSHRLLGQDATLSRQPRLLLESDPERVNDRSIVIYNDENDSSDEDLEPQAKRSRTDLSALAFKSEVAFVANIPATYKEAVDCAERKNWLRAIASEIQSHVKNNTWALIKRKAGIVVIGCKWIFAYKKNERGEIVRFKARLVAQGFSQRYEINFYETYSPVANMNSIRIFLAVCCALNFVIMQCDVDTAFLYASLKEIVYMEVPEGVAADATKVCKLNKALYGLKQSSLVWNQTINAVLLEMGFIPSVADPCVYVKAVPGGQVFVCLYVDDMLIAAKDKSDIERVKDNIRERFSIKDLGHARYILGMEIVNDTNKKKLTIKQSQYITDVAKRFNQSNSKPTENPCDASMKLSSADCSKTDEEKRAMASKPYRSLLGCLLYISTCTRPDISYAVCHLSRYLENPGVKHWKSAIRVLKYLHTTKYHELVFSGNENPNLVAYCDADWGSDRDDRRSVSGVLLKINGGPVVFKSRSQKTVALSSAEAEYMALSLCVQEVLWARRLLMDLGMEQVGATVILEDNQGAIALSKNVGYQARTKHIDIRHHFVREKIVSDEVDVQYVETKHQQADILTKALSTKTLQYLRDLCGLKKR
ncbi:Integrase catalytic core protein, partial [Globisporangium splendens]